eukprot:TRINITY_DN65554_c0_g1_i1.p1 TRINITY_DN65554_c0_g1~~TRINITY_DN65554_c0_g1_i1.p1  ORF type:complete len:152 (+),score=25.37 TRINITY_DN65554_c0_g1_i1:78-533(+)
MALRIVPFVLVSGLCQMLVMFSFCFIPLKWIQEVSDAIGEGECPYRSKDDIRMMYSCVGMPFVNAALLAVISSYFAAEPKDVKSGAVLGLVVWATTALHGIFLDWTYIREGTNVALYFAFGSMVSAAINGSCLGYFSMETEYVRASPPALG